MQRPRPGKPQKGARLDALSGPGLPSQLDIDVHAGPSLGNLRAALDGDETRPPRPAASPRGSSLGSTLGGLVLVVVFGAIGVGLAALWATRDRGPVDVAEEAPMLAPSAGPAAGPAPAPVAAEPAPEPVVAPKAAPKPPPKAAPKPAAKAAPKPKPKPAAPKAPTPAVAALQVRGDAVVELQGEFGGFRAGTPLPPGRYQVFADFGDGMIDTGKTVTAKAGDRIIANCSEGVCAIIQ